jgi:DNA-binding NarL/FixJ family response regulator
MEEIRVFLADGENHVRRAMHLSLDHLPGVIVSGEAQDAEHTLAQISQDSPDVVLLDWQLPGMCPQRMLPVLRKFCPETKILATVLQPQAGQLALTYGFDAYLLKGLSPDEFVKSLKNHLNLS